MIISKITPKNRRHFPETKTSATGKSRMGEGLIEAMGGDIHALVLSPMNSGDDGWFRRWYFDYDNQTCERDETEIGLPEVQVGDDEMASFLVADADIDGYTNTQLVLTNRADDIAAGLRTDAGRFQGFLRTDFRQRFRVFYKLGQRMVLVDTWCRGFLGDAERYVRKGSS